MKLGIHLPQYGRGAGPDAIRAVAQRAEALGFNDVWVSDHVVHPSEQTYPSPYLYDPLLSLTWADAGPVAERVRATKPDTAFTLSLRTGWDPQGMDVGQIRDELAVWSQLGFQHVVSAPWRSDGDAWIRSMEMLVEIVQPERPA